MGVLCKVAIETGSWFLRGKGGVIQNRTLEDPGLHVRYTPVNVGLSDALHRGFGRAILPSEEN